MLFYFNNLAFAPGGDDARRITVSGSVDGGGVLVVRGPSGAGKSTLLRVLARLQPAAGGEVRLGGVGWGQFNATSWRTRVHYLAQKPALFDGTVAENLSKPFGVTAIRNSKMFDIKMAGEIMDQLLLPPSLLQQDARTLSGGEAARVAFVRALLIEPQVLLLDEPTAALDEKSGQAFYGVLFRWLEAPERVALLVSHNDDYGVLKQVSFLDIP